MTAFELNDRVKIEELNREGRVLAINISDIGVQYWVRYFDNASAESVYFFDDELSKV